MRNAKDVQRNTKPAAANIYPEVKALTEQYQQFFIDKTEYTFSFENFDNTLSNKDIAKIRALVKNENIIKLKFDRVSNKAQAYAVAELIKKNNKIQVLSLNNYNAGDEGLSLIVEAFATNTSIHGFTLSGFDYRGDKIILLTQTSLINIAKLIQQDKFKSLSFSGELFKPDTRLIPMATAILATKNLVTFQYLITSYNPSVKLLQKSFDELCELRELCKNPQKIIEFTPKLSWLTPQLFPLLADYLKDQLSIEHLNFIACFADNDGTYKQSLTENHFLLLLEVIKNYKNLSYLDLSYQELNDKSMPHIIELLKHCRAINSNNSGIISLNLSNNKFSNRAIADLADYLYEDTFLLYVDLSDNQIQNYGAVALAKKLVNNGTILSLRLINCPIDQESISQFMKEIKDNGSLIELALPAHKDNTPQYPSYQRYSNNQSAKPSARGLNEFLAKNIGYKNNLLLAARDGDLPKLKQLLMNKHGSPYATDKDLNTPLHLAVQQKKILIVRHFTTTVMINRKIINKESKTAQDLAKETNDAAILACFTQVQQKLFFSPSSVRTPPKRNLDDATSQSEQAEVSPAKKPANVDVNAQPMIENHDSKNKQLYYFALNNDLKKITELVNSGIPIDATNEIGNSCLHGSASVGSHEIVKFSIERNAKINSVNLLGQTPLHLACDYNNLHNTLPVVIELLKSPDCQIDMLDKNNLTPLYMICGGIQSLSDIKKETPDKIEIAWLLIKKGANPAITVNDYEYGLSNMTPLHKAVMRGLYGITKAILSSRRCPINAQNSRNRTALHEAVELLLIDIVERLLNEPDINLKLRDVAGKTALDLINDKLQLSPEMIEALKIKKLLEDRLKTIYLGYTTQVNYVKSLDLIYSKRGKPPLQIEGDKEHTNLKSKFNPEKKGNQLTASLTFVVRNPDGSRHALTINLQGTEFHITMAWKEREEIGDGPDRKTRSRDSLHRILSRHAQAPTEAQQRCTDKATLTQPLQNPVLKSYLIQQVLIHHLNIYFTIVKMDY